MKGYPCNAILQYPKRALKNQLVLLVVLPVREGRLVTSWGRAFSVATPPPVELATT